VGNEQAGHLHYLCRTSDLVEANYLSNDHSTCQRTDEKDNRETFHFILLVTLD